MTATLLLVSCWLLLFTEFRNRRGTWETFIFLSTCNFTLITYFRLRKIPRKNKIIVPLREIYACVSSLTKLYQLQEQNAGYLDKAGRLKSGKI